MTLRTRITIGMLLCLALYATAGMPAANAQVIYDNTVNIQGGMTDVLPTIAYGDEIMTNGTARFVTKVEVGMRAFTATPTLNITAELVLWRPGPGNQRPGSVLFRSGFLPVTLPNGVDTVVTFTVPSVRIPDHAVWTVQVDGFQAFLEGPAFIKATPAVIGNDDASGPGYWIFNPLANQWIFQNIAANSFYCKITAQPRPGPSAEPTVSTSALVPVLQR